MTTIAEIEARWKYAKSDRPWPDAMRAMQSATSKASEDIRFLLNTLAQRDKKITDINARCVERTAIAKTILLERDTARTALRKYGEHTENCEVHSWDLRKVPCTCGFITTLEATK